MGNCLKIHSNDVFSIMENEQEFRQLIVFPKYDGSVAVEFYMKFQGVDTVAVNAQANSIEWTLKRSVHDLLQGKETSHVEELMENPQKFEVLYRKMYDAALRFGVDIREFKFLSVNVLSKDAHKLLPYYLCDGIETSQFFNWQHGRHINALAFYADAHSLQPGFLSKRVRNLGARRGPYFTKPSTEIVDQAHLEVPVVVKPGAPPKWMSFERMLRAPAPNSVFQEPESRGSDAAGQSMRAVT
eukprot:TRINITY_DN9833_c0_g1_i1.p1 TRINITY_DN9833_c0_g1~~TRINITY_DN9833_c0_g1_i1.p1  ORF type:complete len:242 (+),score=25.75 TRINITY_DN9833_c0_g1_i1:21-746(+)